MPLMPMKPRTRNVLLAALAIVVVLPTALVVTMRTMRHRVDAAVQVGHGVVRVRNFFTEIYGLRSGDRIWLFDAGIDTDEHAVDAAAAALGGKRADVSDIFLTHGHFDHVAGAPSCPSATVRVGQADVDLLAQRTPTRKPVARIFKSVLPVGPIEAGGVIPGQQVVLAGEGRELVAIPMPGHTAGSYAFLYEGVLIAGDSIQIDGDHLEFAMPGSSEDMAANRRSIAGLRAALAGRKVEIVCTGHQGCTDGRGGAMLDALIARAEAGR